MSCTLRSISPLKQSLPLLCPESCWSTKQSFCRSTAQGSHNPTQRIYSCVFVPWGEGSDLNSPVGSLGVALHHFPLLTVPWFWSPVGKGSHPWESERVDQWRHDGIVWSAAASAQVQAGGELWSQVHSEQHGDDGCLQPEQSRFLRNVFREKPISVQCFSQGFCGNKWTRVRSCSWHWEWGVFSNQTPLHWIQCRPPIPLLHQAQQNQ